LAWWNLGRIRGLLLLSAVLVVIEWISDPRARNRYEGPPI